ncbi:MAG: hypothetical protein ACO36A_07670 [Ilumatobacteraceae bacterium]
MESLAMAAAVVMLAILLSGVVAALVVVRRPRSTAGRALATVVSLPALFMGGWMWLLDVGIGARLIGLVVFIAGTAALVRTWRAGDAG